MLKKIRNVKHFAGHASEAVELLIRLFHTKLSFFLRCGVMHANREEGRDGEQEPVRRFLFLRWEEGSKTKASNVARVEC